MAEPPKRDVAVWVAVIALAVLVIVWAGGASMMGSWTMPGMGPWMRPTWGAGGAWWWLASAIGLLALVGIAALAARSLQDSADDHAHDDEAMRLARERYARGEITREQFAQTRADLERGAPEGAEQDVRRS